MRQLLFACIIFSIFSTLAWSGPVVVVVGTRPEAIKMIPVFQALKKAQIPTILCSTGQHSEMLDEIFTLFQIEPDFNMKVMQPGQDLFHITTAVLNNAKQLFQQISPSLVMVQGDTTSAMTAALAAFYLKIP